MVRPGSAVALMAARAPVEPHAVQEMLPALAALQFEAVAALEHALALASHPLHIHILKEFIKFPGWNW